MTGEAQRYSISVRYEVSPVRGKPKVYHGCHVSRQRSPNDRLLLTEPHEGLRRAPVRLRAEAGSPRLLLEALASDIDAVFERQAPKLVADLMNGLSALRLTSVSKPRTPAVSGIGIILEMAYESEPPIRMRALSCRIDIQGHFADGSTAMLTHVLRYWDGSSADVSLRVSPRHGGGALVASAEAAAAVQAVPIAGPRVKTLVASMPLVWPRPLD